MHLQVKKIVPEAKLPTRAKEGDAGLDLYSVESCVVEPMGRRAVRTGIALEIPMGYVGLVWDKSGLAAKGGIKTMGGVIDSGYRGEIQVILANLGDGTHVIAAGDKIAQLLIQHVELLPVEEVSDLADSERGADGFGSTGV